MKHFQNLIYHWLNTFKNGHDLSNDKIELDKKLNQNLITSDKILKITNNNYKSEVHID